MFDEVKTIKESDDSFKNKKGFQITIKNLDTEEIISDYKTRAIIGAFAEEVSPNGAIAATGIMYASCDTKTLIGTIEAADKTVSQAKAKVIGDLPPELLLAAILGDKLK